MELVECGDINFGVSVFSPILKGLA